MSFQTSEVEMRCWIPKSPSLFAGSSMGILNARVVLDDARPTKASLLLPPTLESKSEETHCNTPKCTLVVFGLV